MTPLKAHSGVRPCPYAPATMKSAPSRSASAMISSATVASRSSRLESRSAWHQAAQAVGRVLMRRSPLPRSPRQHRNQDTVLQDEVVEQGRGRMQARQPDQSIAEPGMNLRDCSAEPTGGRKKGTDGTDRRQRQRMSAQPRAQDGGGGRHDEEN